VETVFDLFEFFEKIDSLTNTASLPKHFQLSEKVGVWSAMETWGISTIEIFFQRRPVCHFVELFQGETVFDLFESMIILRKDRLVDKLGFFAETFPTLEEGRGVGRDADLVTIRRFEIM
jgi:hypothetical protein